jgi:hypothetical protein
MDILLALIADQRLVHRTVPRHSRKRCGRLEEESLREMTGSVTVTGRPLAPKARAPVIYI